MNNSTATAVETPGRRFQLRLGGCFSCEWTHLYPSPAAERESRDLIRRVGKWSQETDSDLLPGAVAPAWVRDAERRIEELAAQAAPLELPIVVRATEANLSIEMEIQRPVSGLGYEKDYLEVAVDATLDGRRITPAARTWIPARDIFRARSDWRGTGDVRERVYDLASHLLNAVGQRLRIEVAGLLKPRA